MYLYKKKKCLLSFNDILTKYSKHVRFVSKLEFRDKPKQGHEPIYCLKVSNFWLNLCGLSVFAKF